jgi:hypothetical protein
MDDNDTGDLILFGNYPPIPVKTTNTMEELLEKIEDQK